jgi:hypothetical protein
MSHPIHPEKNVTDKNPAHQTGESNGPVSGTQVTDNNMPKADLSRGSETETRGTSRNRS